MSARPARAASGLAFLALGVGDAFSAPGDFAAVAHLFAATLAYFIPAAAKS